MLTTQLALFMNATKITSELTGIVEVFVFCVILLRCGAVETLTGHRNNELPGTDTALKIRTSH